MSTRLPPIIEESKDGEITWRMLEDEASDTIGFVLSCHLVIEHYMGLFLGRIHPGLNWKGADLKYIKLVELLSKYPKKEDNLITPSLRTLNSLRNKFSHNINYKMTKKDLQPIIHYLKRTIKKGEAVPTSEHEILKDYTNLVCFWLARIIVNIEEGRLNKNKGEVRRKALGALMNQDRSENPRPGINRSQPLAEPR